MSSEGARWEKRRREAVGWPEAVSLLEEEVIKGAHGQRWPSSADWHADCWAREQPN